MPIRLNQSFGLDRLSWEPTACRPMIGLARQPRGPRRFGSRGCWRGVSVGILTAGLWMLASGAGEARAGLIPPANEPGKGTERGTLALYVEKPGDMEFSGFLTVRPLQEHRTSASAILRGRDAAARERLAGKVARYFPEVDEYLVRVPSGMARGEGENALASELISTGDYEYVIPDWIVYPIAIPNDPLYNSQWHHPKIGSPLAWDYTLGSTTIISASTDTGIDVNHPDLAAHRVPGFHAPSNTAEVNGGPVTDVNGHGTHVAGCAAAIGNNGVGVTGVNQRARIMMARVTDSSNGSASIS
ncbi:MAG TPA: S8 family serine peptidase, partial [Phycisphaerales bacterium]|nr:S8 family serine peptidase [Phycisphaerales bacterium]